MIVQLGPLFNLTSFPLSPKREPNVISSRLHLTHLEPAGTFNLFRKLVRIEKCTTEEEEEEKKNI